MLRIRPTIAVLILCILGACRSRDDGPSGAPEARLPHVTAPIDTTIVIETRPDTATVASTSEAGLQAPAWTDASFRGLPEPKALHYTRYVNDAHGYSIAYPDTILKPGEPIGEHRGLEFTSPAGRIRMLVFAVDATTPEDLNTQYRAALADPETVITYRARDDRSYIVSGARGEDVFYEKSISDGETLKTFRMQYPAANKAYFDAVAAIMSASFEHFPADG